MSTLRIAGADVPRIGLGTNRLAHQPENVEFIREAVAAGVGLIDTAHLYAGGESEATIGAALGPETRGCVVATKGGWEDGSPPTLAREIEESLARLQTERIALYYLHRVDADVPIEESLGAIVQYRDTGQIADIGVSNVTLEEIKRAQAVGPIAAVQNHYNFSHREAEDVIDYCAAESIAFVPYFPLRGDGPPALREIAARHDATPDQIVLAWLLHRSPTVLPIPGTLSLGHLRENLAALEIELTEDELAALNPTAEHHEASIA
jgi:aryl-alcohol dehydrogenase-like predicted oxidoreductase